MTNQNMEDYILRSDKSELTRRQFVGLAASGATALTILPGYTIGGLGHVAPSDKLYIAAVGCGEQKSVNNY